LPERLAGNPFPSGGETLPRSPAGLLFRTVSTPLQGVDIWTFARNLASHDDGWRAVAIWTEER
jgi:hypothetical protein